MRKFLKLLPLLMFIVVVNYVYQRHSKYELDTLLIDNVEALASGEESERERCYGYGSLDCVESNVKVEYISTMRLTDYE